MPGFQILPMGKIAVQYAFWTVERDPNCDPEEGKRKLLAFFGSKYRFEKDINAKPMCAAVAEVGMKKEYAHYHVIMKTRTPVRHRAIWNELRRKFRFEKPNKKGISAWCGQARQGDMDTWGDWQKYTGMIASNRLGKKDKVFDANKPMQLTIDPKLEAWRDAWLDDRGVWSGGPKDGIVPVVDGERITLFWAM